MLIRAAALVACVALAGFYVVAATEHGRRVNTSKARGDQSGYLWDAENVFANWHGRQPPTVIGERNRMPLYAGYLALFYHPDLSDPDFFEVAKRANIYLSLALLVGLGVIFFRALPTLPAINLTGIAAFGFFIFKAGYAQSELLFYFLMFVTFLGCWRLLRGISGWRGIGLAALTGALAGLAHLTKAAMLPFVAIFLVTEVGVLIVGLTRGKDRTLVWRAATAAIFAIAFLAVLSPYLTTSKRVFGQYFYNVNSTFYVWYDDWASASVGTYAHGDGVGWPTMAAVDLPGPGRYWREHTVGQIVQRIGNGFEDMAVQSVRTYDFLPYLLLYGAMLVVILATRQPVVAAMVRANAALLFFLGAYATLYLLAIAFYFPTSGTGTGRFLLAHLMPLFFALSYLVSRPRLMAARWRIAGIQLSLAHFNVVVLAVLVLDVTFHLWTRLMTTYGGF